MTSRRWSVAVALVALVLAAPPVAALAPTTTAPATSPPTTTVATTVASTVPPDEPAGAGTIPPAVEPSADAESTIAVGGEAAYRAALATLSADGSGPHRIEVTADITVDDGTDPTYTGTQPLTIDGNGHTLDGARANRLLVVDSATDVVVGLVRVTMRHGSASGDGGAVLVGGGSSLSVTDSTFAGNRALGSGGAIEVASTARVVRSDFVDNVAVGGDGGALDGTAEPWYPMVRASQFLRNRAPAGDGGAIAPFAATEVGVAGVQASTFGRNRARRGGALVLAGGFVEHSTVVGNTASVLGGGVLTAGNGLSAGLYLTVTGNAAPRGANLALRGSGSVYLIFSVVAERRGGGANCAGSLRFLTEVEGWSDDRSCGRGMAVGNPRLGPLGDHGGRTRTRLPLPGSGLIDAVEATYGPPVDAQPCAGFLGSSPRDQRGVVRPQDGDGRSRPDWAQGEDILVAADCDIGAVEVRRLGVTPRGGSVVRATPTFVA